MKGWSEENLLMVQVRYEFRVVINFFQFFLGSSSLKFQLCFAKG